MKRIKFYKLLPLLHLDINLPLFSVTTTLMNRSFTHNVFEYMVFRIKLWKYNFDIALIETKLRKLESNNNELVWMSKEEYKQFQKFGYNNQEK